MYRNKWISGFGLSVGIFSFCCLSSMANAAVIAFWEFEPGNLTADSSGNSHTLSNTNVTSSLDVPGTSSSGSAAFNGTNAFLQTSSNLDLSSANQLTLEFFYKSNGDFASDADVFFEHSTNFNSFTGAFVAYGAKPSSDNRIDVGYKSPGYIVDRAEPVPTNDWHHVAIQYDRTAASPAANSDVIKVFIDYSLVTTTEPFLSGGRSSFMDAVLYLGARGGSSLFYNGALDQFRISDTLLSPSEFLQADAPPIPEPGSFALLMLGCLFLKRRR